MASRTPEDGHTDLRYLDAAHVEHPAGTLAGVSVCTDHDEELGALDGVLIEPTARRLRYFVVEPAPRKNGRYVLPADTPAVLDFHNRKLCVTAAPQDLERLRDRIPAFSDEDLLTAVFGSTAA